MLERGIKSFYRRAEKRVTGVYDQQRQAYVPVERPAGEIVLHELRGTPGELRRNDSASILDLGDGVLCLEFHSKANALDPQIIELGYGALELLERPEWNALVIGNQGQDFCLGVNVGLFAMAIQGEQYAMTEQAARQLQDLLMAFRFAPKPVVTAPFGRVLGGGVEVALHGAKPSRRPRPIWAWSSSASASFRQAAAVRSCCDGWSRRTSPLAWTCCRTCSTCSRRSPMPKSARAGSTRARSDFCRTRISW